MGLISRVSSRTYRYEVHFCSSRNSFWTTTPAASTGTELTSATANLLVYMDGVTHGKNNGEGDDITFLESENEEPCRADENGAFICNMSPLTLKVRKDRTTYSLYEIEYNSAVYEPIPSTDLDQSYQHEPTTAIDGGFSCKYTTFIQKDENGKPDYTTWLIFKKFAMQHNSKSVPTGFSNVRDCVGIWNEASVIGVFTILLLLAISALGVGMLTSISTQDRFENPQDKPFSVNHEKTS